MKADTPQEDKTGLWLDAFVDSLIDATEMNHQLRQAAKDTLREKYEAEAARRELALLDGLEAALPDGNSIVQPDTNEVPSDFIWIHFKDQRYAIDQIKQAIEAKRQALNKESGDVG
jgi:hypothetical protein